MHSSGTVRLRSGCACAGSLVDVLDFDQHRPIWIVQRIPNAFNQTEWLNKHTPEFLCPANQQHESRKESEVFFMTCLPFSA